ncbi:MAG: sigma-54 interaction domain-containing protein [bacterium]
MDPMIGRDAYKNILEVAKELIASSDMNEMITKLSASIQNHIPDTIVFAGLWDKYEEELQIFPRDKEISSDIYSFFRFMLKNENLRFQGKFEKSGHSERLRFFRGYHLFWDTVRLEKGIRGAVLGLHTTSANLKKTTRVAETVLPQFWSIFTERYNKAIAGKESEMLWKIKDANSEAFAENRLDSIELNTLLENLLELALRKIKLKCGCILLVNEQVGELEFELRAVRGKSLSIVPAKIKAEEKSLASIVVKTNKTYICNDIEKDPSYYPLFHGVKSSLVVPIEFQQRSIGAIAIESESKNQFSEEDARLIKTLAKEATMFIRRAQLFEETSKKGDAIMIFGNSQGWKDVEKRIERASRTDATVILRGESGTGKELLAHAIHFNSPRKNGPFVTLNCAAIPTELLESEMFGHVKGAFTGAYFNKTGEFEKAEGGTIFLDEIGDLPLILQVKLLRVLQSGEIKPVGSSKVAKRVNVRVIAATSRDLETMLSKGEFRMDMYYRLHVVPIAVPPLRSYKEDIPTLVDNFIKEANSNYNTSVKRISRKALSTLIDYDYPGNVRQLKNFITQAVIMADSETIRPENLPAEIFAKGDQATEKEGQFITNKEKSEFRNYLLEKEKIVEKFTKDYFSNLLRQTGGNIAETAKTAGISRVSLYKILKKFDISES